WGYGKATDPATRGNRLQRMTREEGIAQVARYNWGKPTDKQAFLEGVGMDEAEFYACIDRHREPRNREGEPDHEWRLKDCITNHINDEGVDAARLRIVEDCRFIVTPTKDPAANEQRHTLMARGYKDERPAVNRIASVSVESRAR